MLERATVRLAPVTARTADLAPVVPACCGVCRTCTTTNLVGLAMATAAATSYAVVRLARRIVRR